MDDTGLAFESISAITIAGFSMGIAGSLHCIGMCSPLAMAASHAKPSVITYKLIYNGGRIFTYVMLGMITGLMGFALELTPVQKFLSLLMGFTLVIIGLGGISIRIPAISSAVSRLTDGLKSVFGTWLKRKGIFPTLTLGFLNGLLPCGLTYMALAYTLTLSNSVNAGIFMFAFGMGTLPAMVGVPVFAGLLGSRYKPVLKRFNTIILIALGILLIWRSYYQFHDGMEMHSMEAFTP